jgi:hypothetical protein
MFHLLSAVTAVCGLSAIEIIQYYHGNILKKESSFQ